MAATTTHISRKPVYKSYYPEGYGPIFKLPYLEPQEFLSRFDPGPIRERIFHFSPKVISMLKAKANEESNIDNISSFQALIALIWKSITYARNLDPNSDATCTLTVSTRSRLKPPLTEEHFGNYIAATQVTCKVGELVGHRLGWVALLIHQSIVAKNENAIRDTIKKLARAPFVDQTGTKSVLYKPNSVVVVGSTRFDMYGPEFGIGRAFSVLSGYANKVDGKIIANPGCEGGGSVDLEICLKQQTMSALESNEEFMNFVS